MHSHRYDRGTTPDIDQRFSGFGVDAGDRIVMDGQFNLTLGASVQEQSTGTTPQTHSGNAS